MSLTQNTNRNIVVTGAAGYIGGTICIELKKRAYKVYAIDRRESSHLNRYFDEFICNDFIDYESFLVYKKANPLAIIHCAGTSLVGPSMENPGIYFHNNVCRTISLLNYIRHETPNSKFIFSSSAAVYGNSKQIYSEYMAPDPVSPYGETKLMVENTLKWYKHAHNLKYVAFRYFNACGADPDGKHGQDPNATHIFAKLFEAIKNEQPFTINGTDYPTKDGTCVRDYIHVTDLAEAHIMAIENEIEGVYNLGSYKGTSNLEIYETIINTINQDTPVILDKRREGDPATLIADPTKWNVKTGWSPKYNLEDIINHLNTWYNSKTFKGIKDGKVR